MLQAIFLIVAGLVLAGLLSADFVMLGMRNHLYLARILAVVLVVLAAYTHAWIPLVIVTALITVFLMVRKEMQERADRKQPSLSR
jgi:chromate transport protein ChrA